MTLTISSEIISEIGIIDASKMKILNMTRSASTTFLMVSPLSPLTCRWSG